MINGNPIGLNLEEKEKKMCSTSRNLPRYSVMINKKQLENVEYFNNLGSLIIRFVIPVAVNKPIRVQCMYLSNTTYFI